MTISGCVSPNDINGDYCSQPVLVTLANKNGVDNSLRQTLSTPYITALFCAITYQLKFKTVDLVD